MDALIKFNKYFVPSQFFFFKLLMTYIGNSCLFQLQPPYLRKNYERQTMKGISITYKLRSMGQCQQRQENCPNSTGKMHYLNIVEDSKENSTEVKIEQINPCAY